MQKRYFYCECTLLTHRTYPILLDEGGEVLQMYRANGLPMSVIVDPEGVIRVRHVGYLTASQLDDYLAELMP